MNEAFLREALRQRQEEGKCRYLCKAKGLVDLTSNDTLGFARSEELRHLALAEYGRRCHFSKELPPNGATGSRLLTGNHSYVEELESRLADFHNAAAGLIYSSGYAANVGLLSAVAESGDAVFLDRETHASTWDGARLSGVRIRPFRHNDMEHLDELLTKSYGQRCFVALEALYSISGDLAPLVDAAEICARHGAFLIVDEAHSTGVLGPGGRGRVCELGLESQVFARIHTFGKALGTQGALVLGSPTLREYLINFSRSFIYSTALPLFSLVWIDCAYQLLEYAEPQRKNLRALIDDYSLHCPGAKPEHIQSLVVQGGNERVRELSRQLFKEGLKVLPLLHPTVARGKECLRICLHSFNTKNEIDRLLEALQRKGALEGQTAVS